MSGVINHDRSGETKSMPFMDNPNVSKTLCLTSKCPLMPTFDGSCKRINVLCTIPAEVVKTPAANMHINNRLWLNGSFIRVSMKIGAPRSHMSAVMSAEAQRKRA